MTSTAIYRSLMQALEGRRVELGLSMATATDMAGLPDGYFAKMIYPDTPSGRQARWEQVEVAMVALFGPNFRVDIVADEDANRRLLSAPRVDDAASGNARKIRHWRHRKHFEELGRLGGQARAKLPMRKLKAIARKAAKTRRKRAVEARRQGEKHKAANAAKRAAQGAT